jgi:hypothetical protein
MKWSIRTLIFLLLSYNTQAQDLGSWNVLHLKYHINPTWTTFAEAQLRSLKFYKHYHYYEYKAGVSYKVHPNFSLAFCIGDYDTYKEGGNFVTPKNNDEFRSWIQGTLSQSVGKFRVEQRYRIEQRFTSTGYRNRFRYRFALGYPFGKSIDGKQKGLIQVSNELFFTNNEPYFERNRLNLVVAYPIHKSCTVQLGYLHQFDYKINDETGRDFLQVGFFFELHHQDLKKETENNF